MGDLSEMPSAVASDDEEEDEMLSPLMVPEQDLRRSSDIQRSIEASGSQGRQSLSDRVNRLDEVDRLGEEDGEEQEEATEELLPKRPVLMRPVTGTADLMGLTEETKAVTYWKKGRADLREVLEDDLKTTDGPMNVTGESSLSSS